MLYDAVLIVSFGGPEGFDDVIPFLCRVTSGRNIPRERLDEVAEQYYSTGGVSPLNEQCRRLRSLLAKQIENAGYSIPVYWGNRNWHPLLNHTMQEMAQAGHKRVLAVLTSAYSSYSGCRQYLEDIANARAAIGVEAPVVDVLRPYHNHKAFTELFADAAGQARQSLAQPLQHDAVLLATAHSIPMSMARACEYENQLRSVTQQVAHLAGFNNWDIAWQSRSGPPAVPWLEPDINDYLELNASRLPSVVLIPLGFVTDHSEVLWDLDVVATETASNLDIPLVRAVTPGTEPEDGFVSMWLELIEQALTSTSPDVCPPGCCPRS